MRTGSHESIILRKNRRLFALQNPSEISWCTAVAPASWSAGRLSRFLGGLALPDGGAQYETIELNVNSTSPSSNPPTAQKLFQLRRGPWNFKKFIFHVDIFTSGIRGNPSAG
jgi:hypothetical protein